MGVAEGIIRENPSGGFRRGLAVFLLLLVVVNVASVLNLKMSSSVAPKKVLLVGGTRFSGLYLWKELQDRGHEVSMFNRGKTPVRKTPRETDEEFDARCKATKFIAGDRKDFADMKAKLSTEKYDVVYDLGGREAEDTEPLVELFGKSVEHFVYMSSAGVYKKSVLFPHSEESETDPKSRHKGKLNTEKMLADAGVPFTSIRPTYIYGPYNYNPIVEFFFERLDAKRPICVPGHGDHFTGLGHVEDLAVAMAQVIGRDVAKGQIYNVQDETAITFTGLVKECAKATGMKDDDIKIQYFDTKKHDLGKDAKGKARKAFPMREQHFFTSVEKAKKDLDWEPKYSLADGLIDSYKNDFLIKKAAGGLKGNFDADDIILQDDRVVVKMFDGMGQDSI